MYLYFDKTGKLKEIINDEALRQGNYNVNKMYVYIDRTDVSSIDASYLLPSSAIVNPVNFLTSTTATIPFNAKRDLLYFKYYKEYTFFEIDLSAGDSQDEDNVGNTALDEAGVVHCSMTAILSDNTELALGDYNFIVEENAVLNQKYVASQEYLSLGDYLFLRALIDRMNPGYYVPYTGADSDLDIGAHKIKSSDSDGLTLQSTNNDEFNFIGNVDGTDRTLYFSLNDFTDNVRLYLPNENGSTVATQEWVTSRNYVPYSQGGIDLGQYPLKTEMVQLGTSAIMKNGNSLDISSSANININIDGALNYGVKGEVATLRDVEQALTPTSVGQATIATVNGFKTAQFTIGSDYQGLYIFTWANNMVLISIYGLTDDTEYKVPATFLRSDNSGYDIKVLTYKKSGTTLLVYSKENALINGYVAYLFKVKLY